MKFAIAAIVLAVSSSAVLANNGQGKGPAQGSLMSSIHANDNALLNANPNAAFKSVTAVPEADTIAMLVAGVAVVGAVALRRRNKK
ncbi:PEP-CTERM sorting domain-containing protein [Aquabacterium fontiphilum]|uniref:PEP-CTERM sorting domain-containing protein n=1 Tax=Aquabacterium fontiphilum TaxID=450365 RepID=UPI00191C6800|nr:PEP-CTERM sorting domain-containing protein [Aquabacterium fontiphilum]